MSEADGHTSLEQQTPTELHTDIISFTQQSSNGQHSTREQHTTREQQTISEQQTLREQHTTHELQTISEEHSTHGQQTTCEEQSSRVQQTSREQQAACSSNTNGDFDPLLTVINKIAEGERVPPQITMRYEMLRFCTLRSFPKENKPYITRIASAGFYYANVSDEVVCYCCARRKRNWTESDNPMEVHRELNPNCSFLIRNSEVNIPIKPSTNNPLGQLNTNSSTARGRQNSETRHGSTEVNLSSDTVTGSQSEANQNSSSLVVATSTMPLRIGNQSNSLLPVDVPETLTVNQSAHVSSGNASTTPKYPNYSSIEARRASFDDCGDIIISPDILSQAGFFYAGFGDCVRCYQCGVGLRHWSDEDDPWIEHSRWSKDCVYVLRTKGREFVNLVQMAVQYSQNQNRDEITIPQDPGNTDISSGNAPTDIERLMHTSAAQSVLEMGYNPDVIRRAIRMVLSSSGHGILSATNIMDRIFQIEESESGESDIHNNAEVPTSRVENRQTNGENVAEPRNSNEDRSNSENAPEESATRATGQENSTGSHSRRQEVLEFSSSGSSRTSKMQTTNDRSSSASREAHLNEQRRLKEENDQLKQQSLCTKCKTNDVSIVFLPCGHLITCETCAPTVRYCTMTSCGKYIKGTVRTYLS